MSRGYDYRDKYQLWTRAEAYNEQPHFKSPKGRFFIWCEKRRLKAAFKSVLKGGYVLDMPCGTGRITEQLLAQGFRVLGGDVSESMLAVALSKLDGHKNLKGLKLMDGADIPYGADTFNGVVCIRFMCNIPFQTQRRILKELARVSKGQLIIGFSLSSPVMKIRNWIKRILGISTNKYPVSVATIKDWAFELNLKVKSLKPAIPFFSEELIAVLEHGENG